MTDIRPYWKPEPKLWDWSFWSLLIPAAVWVIGVIFYGAQALMAAELEWTMQDIGSTLMVIGGEAGTLFTVMEVFRKSKSDDANFWDWSGIFVSLVSTLGVMLVIFTRQTTIVAMWIDPVRNWGPLVLLLCSALDFYANVVELGYFRASFEARCEKWDANRWAHDRRERERVQGLSEAVQEPAEPAPLLAPKPQDKSDILAGLNGDRAGLTVDLWNAALVKAGFTPDNPSTARYWIDKAKAGEC